MDTIYGDSDSNAIQSIFLTPHPYVESYLRHPGFNDYPVVGVSYEQATEFCKWRTLAVNYYVHCKNNSCIDKGGFLGKSFPIKINYRLPTKHEWEMLARVGLDSNNKYFKKLPKDRSEWIFYHTKEAINSITKRDRDYHRAVFYTCPTKSYFPNKFDLYQLIGNVAEIISKKGLAKGGSFVHTFEESKITWDQNYTKPERWLGFRCVAVVNK
jgi:formylglycine-generating enzyme required for sulfatase activity